MAAPWPQWMTNSFLSANQPQFANDESAYYGPYTRLLYHLFGIEGPFEIILIKPPSSFHLDSKRKQADDQMRDRFRDLRANLVTPRLPAISAFGTRVAFYEYIAATNAVTPPAIAADPIFLNDVAPADRWNYDLLEADGIARMRQVAQDVRAMCQALDN
ncbi:hypothetical protein BC826DRAFT_950059 [Russula brevipes]|nr:hypothetical protein BC826DRAFT_950059 [Russula brevipes]